MDMMISDTIIVSLDVEHIAALTMNILMTESLTVFGEISVGFVFFL